MFRFVSSFLSLKKNFGDKPGPLNNDNLNATNFVCNICGTFNSCDVVKIDRDVPSCIECGSAVRMRAVVHLLSVSLFGESRIINDFSKTAGVVVMGLSDWEGYAKPLSGKLNYTNTFFHQEPFLDIINPCEKDFEKYDFIIASDVFEHVPPPASSAFEGAYKLLKPNGVLILTVPFTNEEKTKENFPDLGEYQIINFQDREYILVNQNSEGEFNTYKDLVFHGGPGTTLEMRVFCRKDLTANIQDTGFQNIQYFDSDVPEYGILHKVNWSLPVTAQKPKR